MVVFSNLPFCERFNEENGNNSLKYTTISLRLAKKWQDEGKNDHQLSKLV